MCPSTVTPAASETELRSSRSDQKRAGAAARRHASSNSQAGPAARADGGTSGVNGRNSWRPGGGERPPPFLRIPERPLRCPDVAVEGETVAAMRHRVTVDLPRCL